jgi:aspartate aminotransferase-like enzyme
MPALLPNIDPSGLLEYSVVYTDRSLNHMSKKFQTVMKDISTTLKEVYNGHSAIVVPGSGTFGMEAVARQYANNKKCMIIRNGWFSYRWTQIFDMGNIPSESIVLKARKLNSDILSAFSPPPIKEVITVIKNNKPDIIFVPHVETSSGIILPDDYLKAIGEAIHSVGGLFVLDCIASGAVWVDMKKNGVDILISAPQKSWSASPCCALVMLSELARKKIEETTSTSFACDLKKWLQIMETYESGTHAYHATMPTDGLNRLRDTMNEAKVIGFDKLKLAQQELGEKVREVLTKKGFMSVAAEGFTAPGVIVSYTTDPEISTGKKFLGLGLQIAAGVPLQCDEPADFKTFRIGLFGLDKLLNIERTILNLENALN